MTKQEKEFGLDLLKALDMGTCGKLRTEDDYKEDLQGSCRKDILDTVRELIRRGYKREETE